jgi:transposase InsO family protein
MSKVTMSTKELDRVQVIEDVINGRCTQRKASETLKISLRQVKRLCKRYKNSGVQGLAHLSRGKPSMRRMNEETQDKVMKLLSMEEFSRFGPTLLQETFEEDHHIKVSREWLRNRMVSQGKWQPKKTKKSSIHPRRKRRCRKGELIQLDGSYEYWFEDRGERCCLLVMIDDATSEIMALRFVGHETTQDYFEIMREYINRYDLPLALYSDRHSVFKVSRREVKETDIFCSQFERAMKELGVEMIHARSPQAKGRVERANGVLQDRLIKKMRRQGIATLEDGNKFLEKYRKEHNSKFAVQAENHENAHVKLLPSLNLNRILVIKEKRKVSKNLEVQYQNVTYQLDLKNSSRRMQGREINVFVKPNGEVSFEYQGMLVKHSIYKEISARKTVLDHKELEVVSERKKPLTIIQRQRRGISCNF